MKTNDPTSDAVPYAHLNPKQRKQADSLAREYGAKAKRCRFFPRLDGTLRADFVDPDALSRGLRIG